MNAITGGAAAIGLGFATLATTASPPQSTSQAKAVQTMESDFAARSPDIHWAPGFDPAKADLFAHNQRLIRASCDKVFARIADAATWPSWYANARNVALLDGATALAAGTRFRWTTFGLAIESRVHEFEPGRRIGWFGYTPGQPPAFYHTWLLTPVDGGCMTVMEEVGNGAAPAHLRDTDQSLMHRGHDLWLATLGWMSESVGG